MNLPPPPPAYDPTDEAQVRRAISQADDQNVKLTGVLDKLMFRDTATGVIKIVVVTSGAFVIS